ncbi:acyl-CoA-binding protein homolog [Odontomachus brunneus]|uniref:acyl-CoA-binding protein homolog n=1 Tax=Odontomachus brunneus TaxID=486640 RepID=UPI0013F2738E|nr:acyl-CoA-binding protein homolog [Odontomachus brunneus]XP_032689297.1 acyl-CoA-binding protein homolog [Odontomachus brunneus]XP_032689303.1 acyl-CoA-binding protein homolog [Odontomachus brunneus]
MSLDQKFNEAAEAVKALTKLPNDEELLELYGLFKQATVGDNNMSKPGMFDLKGKAKWEAWNKKKGTTKEAAQQAYIELVDKMIEKYK